MPDELFVDTNILVYAHDVDAGAKHRIAKELIVDSWHRTPLPYVSIQFLQELLVNLRRKGIGAADARLTVEDYLNWRIVENSVSLFEQGLEEMDRWRISLWDAMILAAARYAGAKVVWSEDLGEKQDYDGIAIVNPFRNA